MDRPHINPDAMQQELGLDNAGLPTEAFFERLGVDAGGLEADLLTETLLRVVAVGDASVLPLVSPLVLPRFPDPLMTSHCQGHAARLQGTVVMWHRNKSGSWHRLLWLGLLQEVFDEIAGLQPAARFAPHLGRVAEAAAPGPGFLQYFVSIATRPGTQSGTQARILG